jgi:hypothetical protein
MKVTEEQLKEMCMLVEAIAHIGVDFGYGKFALEETHIKRARALIDEINNKGGPE